MSNSEADRKKDEADREYLYKCKRLKVKADALALSTLNFLDYLEFEIADTEKKLLERLNA